MSRGNVDLVLSVFDAFRERDNEALFRLYDADVEWDTRSLSQGLDIRGVFRGHEGIKRFFRVWLETITDYEIEARDPLDLGDKVVITAVDRGRGRGSGATTERRHSQVWTVRGGKVIRVEIFDDRDQALEAAGLKG